ncbi:8-oxoguanine deaminase [Pseudovibrio axinellae]|uniref:8-oxoguanine deaminase n=1 Tax=Pseudovibrio axinellae TaxID=989403 RepID=A0A161VCY7_9HYPH|nr:formimidoylglutamate deiminase [Pseudovibrio axinellae]KZL22104.1 8-oxoguanine deaminase [Pseudovibrio axinellae]SEQ55130.1 formiminoglutamate deiminase [Pseudovibrio axinellae]
MKSIFAGQALLPTGLTKNVRLHVDETGKITSIETGVEPAGDEVGSLGKLICPAPANLHSHAFQRAMAGMTEVRQKGKDSFWTWRELMYRFLGKLGPEQVEAIAALVYMEMLEAGYASVGEFHYLHHQPDGTAYANLAEMSNRVFAAASQTGIGLTHLPVLYSYGGAREQALSGGQLRFGNDLDRHLQLIEQAEKTLASALPSDCRVGIAPHSLRATNPEQLRAIAKVFAGKPVHIHISEQMKEVEAVQEWLGARPIEWLLENVDVRDNWCFVHATHMSEAETVAMAKAGAVAGLCPITEANLGDGIFNGPTFIEAGGVYGIGSDSNLRISLSEELRILEYSQRLRDQSRNVMLCGEGSVGTAMFYAAAKGGAQALGRHTGTLAKGYLADVVAIDTARVEFSGLKPEQYLDYWIFAGDDRVVSDVWSAGRHMVEHGEHIHRQAIAAKYREQIAVLLDEA